MNIFQRATSNNNMQQNNIKNNFTRMRLGCSKPTGANMETLSQPTNAEGHSQAQTSANMTFPCLPSLTKAASPSPGQSPSCNCGDNQMARSFSESRLLSAFEMFSGLEDIHIKSTKKGHTSTL